MTKIICALDTKNSNLAFDYMNNLYNHVDMFKLGLEFYMSNGLAVLKVLANIDCPIFLDLKLYDIPNTIARTIEIFNDIDMVKMITVHSEDAAIVRAAVDSANHIEIIGVTLLTSIGGDNTTDIVLYRTDKALEGGAAGIVCSAKEVAVVREVFGDDFKIIIPGVRWGKYIDNDQIRTGTPKEIADTGADYLVVGRPITQSKYPITVIRELKKQINYG